MWMFIFFNSVHGVSKTNSHLGSSVLEKSKIQGMRPNNMHQHHCSFLVTFGASSSTWSQPQDGAPRVSLEHQYFIPEGLIIISWVWPD
jgi:hypothetical protein